MNVFEDMKEKVSEYYLWIDNKKQYLNLNNDKLKNDVKFYLFEVLFYMYTMVKYLFALSVDSWNNLIDYVNISIPEPVTRMFPLKCFKIGKETDFFYYNGYSEEIDVSGNIFYNKTHTNDQDMLFMKRKNYDYVIVNHHGGIKNKELFKKVLNRSQLEKLSCSDELNEFEVCKKNPFIYLCINTNKNGEDISNTDELDIGENMDCYNKLKLYFVKENIIDREFLNLFMNVEYNIELDRYPNYVIDIVTNDIKEKHYKKDETFEYVIK